MWPDKKRKPNVKQKMPLSQEHMAKAGYAGATAAAFDSESLSAKTTLDGREHMAQANVPAIGEADKPEKNPSFHQLASLLHIQPEVLAAAEAQVEEAPAGFSAAAGRLSPNRGRLEKQDQETAGTDQVTARIREELNVSRRRQEEARRDLAAMKQSVSNVREKDLSLLQQRLQEARVQAEQEALQAVRHGTEQRFAGTMPGSDDCHGGDSDSIALSPQITTAEEPLSHDNAGETENKSRQIAAEAAGRLYAAKKQAASANLDLQNQLSVKQLRKQRQNVKKTAVLAEPLPKTENLRSVSTTTDTESVNEDRLAQRLRELQALKEQTRQAELLQREQARKLRLNQESAQRLQAAREKASSANCGLKRVRSGKKRTQDKWSRNAFYVRHHLPEIPLEANPRQAAAHRETPAMDQELSSRRRREQFATRLQYAVQMNKLADEQTFREICQPLCDPMQSFATGEAIRLAVDGHIQQATELVIQRLSQTYNLTIGKEHPLFEAVHKMLTGIAQEEKRRRAAAEQRSRLAAAAEKKRLAQMAQWRRQTAEDERIRLASERAVQQLCAVYDAEAAVRLAAEAQARAAEAQYRQQASAANIGQAEASNAPSASEAAMVSAEAAVRLAAEAQARAAEAQYRQQPSAANIGQAEMSNASSVLEAAEAAVRLSAEAQARAAEAQYRQQASAANMGQAETSNASSVSEADYLAEDARLAMLEEAQRQENQARRQAAAQAVSRAAKAAKLAALLDEQNRRQPERQSGLTDEDRGRMLQAEAAARQRLALWFAQRRHSGTCTVFKNGEGVPDIFPTAATGSSIAGTPEIVDIFPAERELASVLQEIASLLHGNASRNDRQAVLSKENGYAPPQENICRRCLALAAKGEQIAVSLLHRIETAIQRQKQALDAAEEEWRQAQEEFARTRQWAEWNEEENILLAISKDIGLDIRRTTSPSLVLPNVQSPLAENELLVSAQANVDKEKEKLVDLQSNAKKTQWYLTEIQTIGKKQAYLLQTMQPAPQHTDRLTMEPLQSQRSVTYQLQEEMRAAEVESDYAPGKAPLGNNPRPPEHTDVAAVQAPLRHPAANLFAPQDVIEEAAAHPEQRLSPPPDQDAGQSGRQPLPQMGGAGKQPLAVAWRLQEPAAKALLHEQAALFDAEHMRAAALAAEQAAKEAQEAADKLSRLIARQKTSSDTKSPEID